MTDNFKPVIIGLNDLLDKEIPDIEWISYPLIPQKGISLISAQRGIGKSWLAMGIAVASASGFDFATFRSDKPRKVLYVDGEMPSKTLQERFAHIIKGFEAENKHVITKNILIYGNDLQGEQPMFDLAHPDKIQAFNDVLKSIGDVELIIMDNIITLYTYNDENSASDWQRFNNWSKEQRKLGRAILWIHHTGKSVEKGARGSSAIEALLDSSLLLKNPVGYNQKQGAYFAAEYTKSRNITGEAINSFNLKLVANGDTISFVQEKPEPDTDTKNQIREMLKNGQTPKEIAETTGYSKSKVYNACKELGLKAPTKTAEQQKRINCSNQMFPNNQIPDVIQ